MGIAFYQKRIDEFSTSNGAKIKERKYLNLLVCVTLSR